MGKTFHVYFVDISTGDSTNAFSHLLPDGVAFLELQSKLIARGGSEDTEC